MRILPAVLSLLLFIFIHLHGITAASDTVAKPPRYDTAYIFDYKYLLTARIYLLIQDTKLVLDQQESGKIIFKPNLPFKLGIAGFYKWFGLGLSLYSPFSFIDEQKNGKTKALDLRLNLYSNVFAIEGHLLRIKGFYVSNFAGPAGTHYTSPEMLIYSIGLSGYYIYNYKRFSLRSAYFQNEWQKKSAGSLIGRLSVNVSTLDADSGMIPRELLMDYNFDSLNNYTSGTLVSASLTPGYAYNFVFLKRCYLHAGLLAGPQYNSLTDRTSGKNVQTGVFSMLLLFRGAIGYNGNKFHAGFSAILSGLQPLASEHYNFYMDPPQYRLWVGTRFDVFKKKTKKK
jgi:hypothetical protein